MKRFMVIVLTVIFAAGIYAADKKEVRKEVKVEKIYAQKDWEEANAKAKALAIEGKYIEASSAYLEAGRIAKQVNDGFQNTRSAWALNNTAYMLILAHMKDKKVSLDKANECLIEALAIKGISAECEKIIKSNINYVRRFVK